MDVLFCTTVDGSMPFVYPVAAQIAERGYTVHLIAGDSAPRGDFPHSSSMIPMTRGIDLRSDANAIQAWLSELRRIRPRMIVAGTPKASLLSLSAAKITRVPTRLYVLHGAVWDGRGGAGGRVLREAERATIAASTHQLAVSDSLARLVYLRGLSRTMPTVLGSGSYVGVDIDRFAPSRTATASPAVMCFVGRLNRDKGIDVLLRTLDRVREHVDATLTVVGGVDTSAPPSKATLRSLTQHPFVHWVGEVSDVSKYLREAAILLFPTAREGLSQVALEAQASGVPVVSWRVTGVLDAVRDGFTGILVPFGDEVELARAATSLLTDKQLHWRMSSNARDWAVTRFARDSVVSVNTAFLCDLLANGSGNG